MRSPPVLQQHVPKNTLRIFDRLPYAGLVGLFGDFPWCLCFLPLAPSSIPKNTSIFFPRHRITSIYQIKTVIKDNKINTQTKSANADTSTILDDIFFESFDISCDSLPQWRRLPQQHAPAEFWRPLTSAHGGERLACRLLFDASEIRHHLGPGMYQNPVRNSE